MISSIVFYQTMVFALVLSKLDCGNATLVGLPANLLNRQQTVLNAAARSIAGLRRSAHIIDTRASFHCHTSSRANQVQAGGHCLASFSRLGACLIGRAALLICRLEVDFGGQLPTNLLSVCRVLSQFANDHSLLLDRAVKCLPDDITSASSLTMFRRKLKTHLFRQSYPDIIM